MNKTKTRQLHLLVTEDAYEQLRLMAFQQRVSMAALVTRGIAHLLALPPQTPPPANR